MLMALLGLNRSLPLWLRHLGCHVCCERNPILGFIVLSYYLLVSAFAGLV